MDLIDLEDEQIDAEVLDSLAVSMDNFRVCVYAVHVLLTFTVCYLLVKFSFPKHNLLPVINMFVQAHSFGKSTCRSVHIWKLDFCVYFPLVWICG